MDRPARRKPDLPDEVAADILDRLRLQDLARFSKTSRAGDRVADDEYRWRKDFRATFGDSMTVPDESPLGTWRDLYRATYGMYDYLALDPSGEATLRLARLSPTEPLLHFVRRADGPGGKRAPLAAVVAHHPRALVEAIAQALPRAAKQRERALLLVADSRVDVRRGAAYRDAWLAEIDLSPVADDRPRRLALARSSFGGFDFVGATIDSEFEALRGDFAVGEVVREAASSGRAALAILVHLVYDENLRSAFVARFSVYLEGIHYRSTEGVPELGWDQPLRGLSRISVVASNGAELEYASDAIRRFSTRHTDPAETTLRIEMRSDPFEAELPADEHLSCFWFDAYADDYWRQEKGQPKLSDLVFSRLRRPKRLLIAVAAPSDAAARAALAAARPPPRVGATEGAIRAFDRGLLRAWRALDHAAVPGATLSGFSRQRYPERGQMPASAFGDRCLTVSMSAAPRAVSDAAGGWRLQWALVPMRSRSRVDEPRTAERARAAAAQVGSATLALCDVAWHQDHPIQGYIARHPDQVDCPFRDALRMRLLALDEVARRALGLPDRDPAAPEPVRSLAEEIHLGRLAAYAPRSEAELEDSDLPLAQVFLANENPFNPIEVRKGRTPIAAELQ